MPTIHVPPNGFTKSTAYIRIIQTVYMHSLKQFFLAYFLFINASFGYSQQTNLKQSYTKIERLIPMRDGVKLFTAIYIPKDSTELHPFILTRTPYSCEPYGEAKFPRNFGNPAFSNENYIVVVQDVRGRHMSEGTFTEVTPYKPVKKSRNDVDESSDTYDTIDWLLQNIKGNNGKVGIHGISYPGFYATASLTGAHPALKAVSPQAPVTDEFEGDDVYHRGAFYLLDNVDFLNFFDNPRKGPQQDYPQIDSTYKPTDAYGYFLKLGPLSHVNDSIFHNRSVIWNEYLAHSSNDAYWKARNIRPHLKNIKPAVLVVGGWFDAEDMFGALKTYEAIEKQNLHNNNYLLMGPWTHGGWAWQNFSSYATYNFGINTSEKFFETEAAFFNYYLMGKGEWNQPEASIFFTGINEWRSFKEWPVKNAANQTVYLNKKQQLSFEKPSAKKGNAMYVSDPASPVPYTALTTGSRDQQYLGADQRFLEKRNDVLSFSSQALKSNLTVAGPVLADLFVSTTGTDADFIVKIIDVLPDSTQQLVRAEVIRGKFRNSFSNPEPFIPGKITEVKLVLNDMAHCFLAGHRIMVQIQSSWFPLVDRNPQKFINIPTAKESDYQKATIRIEHNSRYPSKISFSKL